jgi:hypothetical protein
VTELSSHTGGITGGTQHCLTGPVVGVARGHCGCRLQRHLCKGVCVWARRGGLSGHQCHKAGFCK